MAAKLKTATAPRRGPGRPSNADREARALAQQRQATAEAAARPAGADPTSNVTDETILEYLDQASPLHEDMLAAREKYRMAQGKFRAVLKKAEQNNVIELEWLLKQRKRDIHEVDREIAMRNRLAKLGKLPIGTQLGFLPGMTTVATVVDEQQIAEQAARPQVQAAGPEPKPEDEETERQEEEAPSQPGPEPAPIQEPEAAAAKQPAPPSTTGEFADAEEAKAYNQGGRARMFGRAVEANVYPKASGLAKQWERGWRDKDAASPH